MTHFDTWKKWIVSQSSWFAVLAAALIVANVTLCFIYLSVYLVLIALSTFGIEDFSSTRDGIAISVIAEWGAFFFFFAGSLIAARTISSLAFENTLRWGFATGCATAVASWMFANLLYPPARVLELGLFVVLGILAGLLGGLWGHRVSRMKQSFLRASEGIIGAGDEHDVLTAIGDNLGNGKIREVRLWNRTDLSGDITDARSLGTFRTVALWRRNLRESINELPTASVRMPEPLRRETERQARDGNVISKPMEISAMLLRTSEVSEGLLPPDGKSKAVLLAPLTNLEGCVISLLTVYLASLPQGRVLREYRSVVGQALTRLTNLRLVAEARKAAVSEERSRMGRELHDTVAQGLIGIITLLDGTSSGAAYSYGVPLESAEEARLVSRASITARRLLMEVRRAVHALRNPDLSTGLEDALDQLIKELTENSEEHIELETVGEIRGISSIREGALYGVAREALINASRHADAGRVKLTLSYGVEAVLLDVRDDGRGFDVETMLSQTRNGNSHGGGVGLRSMQERMDEVGGSLKVRSRPGAGTTVTARLPKVSRLARTGDSGRQSREPG